MGEGFKLVQREREREKSQRPELNIELFTTLTAPVSGLRSNDKGATLKLQTNRGKAGTREKE